MTKAEETTPFAIVHDGGAGLLTAFLQAQPQWLGHGVWPCRSALDPGAPELTLYVLTQAADAAFTAWHASQP